MTIRVILDTDIGTDVDDCLALALLLNSPEANLEAVTCVYGDVALRARIALKLLQLRGVDDVPVMTGAGDPLLKMDEIYWDGHEGDGILESGDEKLAPADEFAPDAIIRRVMDNPGEIHLIAIAPLTNIALAMSKEPRLAQNLAHLTIMGGVARGITRLDLPVAEHNILCDPEAARIVFASGAPITLIPLDITTQVRIDSAGVARIKAHDSAFHQAVAGQVERYPRYQKKGYTNTHDPLAVASVIMPDVVTLQPVHIAVETAGHHSIGATWMQAASPDETRTQVAVAVDVARFESFLLNRLAGVTR
ncbi:MAG: nucleoside hydrolase [Chloroflexi bacterium]|nr:MAG: nucleoside hydrolase [Chloroflexota bacterium]